MKIKENKMCCNRHMFPCEITAGIKDNTIDDVTKTISYSSIKIWFKRVFATQTSTENKNSLSEPIIINKAHGLIYQSNIMLFLFFSFFTVERISARAI